MMRLTFALMAAYLALMTALAFKYDWQFFMNDVIALVLFAALTIVVLATDPPWRHHR